MTTVLVTLSPKFRRVPFTYYWLTLIPASISNYTHYKMCDEITHTFPNFKGCIIEVWELISNFIAHLTWHMITYPCVAQAHLSIRIAQFQMCNFHPHINDWYLEIFLWYYNDVIIGVIASQITSLAIVYSAVYSDADQRKHHSSGSLAFVRRIHRWPVNFPHKWPVTRKMFDDVIMNSPNVWCQSQLWLRWWHVKCYRHFRKSHGEFWLWSDISLVFKSCLRETFESLISKVVLSMIFVSFTVVKNNHMLLKYPSGMCFTRHYILDWTERSN